MPARNEEKRNEILSVAYRLFSDASFDKVSLAEIAKGADINKSLLQHYFPTKSDIVIKLLTDVLDYSFMYMDRMPYDYRDLFQKISDFDMLFFKAAEHDERFDQFIMSSVSQPKLLDVWIDIICRWLHRLCGTENFSWLQLRAAICFSMGGSMHLFQHKDELGLDYRFICSNHMVSILHLLNYDPQIIKDICATTSSREREFSISQFLQYLSERIPWFKF